MKLRNKVYLAIAVVLLASLSTDSARADDEKAVKEANAGFYSALNTLFTGDAAAMSEVWSHADDVTYMGPSGKFNVGWKSVKANWARQAAMKLGGKVEPADVHITVGKDLAVVHNFEKGMNINPKTGKRRKVSIRATNVFRKEDGKWKMIGHHVDLLPFLVKKKK